MLYEFQMLCISEYDVRMVMNGKFRGMMGGEKIMVCVKASILDVNASSFQQILMCSV
jgi:hypothetical protein